MIDLVDFGLEPVVKDSRLNEMPQEAAQHILTAKRSNVSRCDTSQEEK